VELLGWPVTTGEDNTDAPSQRRQGCLGSKKLAPKLRSINSIASAAVSGGKANRTSTWVTSPSNEQRHPEHGPTRIIRTIRPDPGSSWSHRSRRSARWRPRRRRPRTRLARAPTFEEIRELRPRPGRRAGAAGHRSPSVQEAVQHRYQQVGAPGHLHVRGIGKHGQLRAGDEPLHQRAVLDGGEVAVAQHQQDR
jgi:hypothetical protein